MSEDNERRGACYDWRRMDSRQAGVAVEETARFADWLCSVDDAFDSALPDCWLHHPWVVLLVDALRLQYDGVYMDGRDYPRGGTEFIISLGSMTAKLLEWRKGDGHGADHECSRPATGVSPLRLARHRMEVADGVDSSFPSAWPVTSVELSRSSLEALSDPGLREDPAAG
jgi:hypothetical protein